MVEIQACACFVDLSLPFGLYLPTSLTGCDDVLRLDDDVLHRLAPADEGGFDGMYAHMRSAKSRR